MQDASVRIVDLTPNYSSLVTGDSTSTTSYVLRENLCQWSQLRSTQPLLARALLASDTLEHVIGVVHRYAALLAAAPRFSQTQ